MRKRILLATISIAVVGCGTHQSVSKTVLTDTHWGLRKLDGETLRPGPVEIVARRFDPGGTIDGTAICNKVSTGSVWAQETGRQSGRVSNSGVRPTSKTVVGCGKQLENKVADHFWNEMENAVRWSINDGRLILSFQDKSNAELVPVPAPASDRPSKCSKADTNNFDCQ